MTQSILIVDDDPVQRRLIETPIQKAGFETLQAASGRMALEVLNAPEGQKIALVILDLVMPDMDGIEVLEQLRPTHPQLPVIVLTAHGGIDHAVKAMRAGADDFLIKPVSPERLTVSIQNALKVDALTDEITRLKKKATSKMTFDNMIASSPAMAQVIKLGVRAAQSNIPIIIEGESGVGKELIARAIQGSSKRSGKPFITVNCGAIPENLVESILFGHEKGSFTGATEKHTGKFVEADSGTLFLDEVGELPLDMQVKLLRALQESEVDPVGAKRPVKVDIRIISATNRDCVEMVKAGQFREDLYYRLNVFPILVPALRKRKEDIPQLVHHFITKFAVEEGKKIQHISADAMAMLAAYDWPGNVRQLENTVFRAIVLCDGGGLVVDDFPQISSLVDMDQLSSEPDITGYIPEPATPVYEPQDFMAAAMPATPPPGDGISALDQSGELRRLEEVEADMIQLALERYQGHMSEVARRLGIGRSTLYRKVRELGLEENKA